MGAGAAPAWAPRPLVAKNAFVVQEDLPPRKPKPTPAARAAGLQPVGEQPACYCLPLPCLSLAP